MAILKYLFSPIKIGVMEVKNRLVMPPMGINFGVDERGHVTDQLTAYFMARAKGGAGMLSVGGAAVHPTGLDLPNLPRIWADEYIPAFREMTNAIHRYDVKFGIQLLHGGRQCYHGEGVAPSPIPAQGVVKGTPRELTIPEIWEVVEAFGDSARRSEEAGFDHVEIHGAHGYLITEFLALNSNKREDDYGGSFENRIRFLLEIIRDIKKKTSPDFPVGVRLNGDDYIKDGWTIEDAKRLAPILEKEGVTYLSITAGIYGSYPPGISIPSMYAKQGVFIHLAEEIKKVVSIPVMGVGRIKKPEHANDIIKEGRADMVCMGRALLADPEMPNKAQKGELYDIRPCIGCCLGCAHNVFQLQEASCVINPEVNREYLFKDGLSMVPVSKKVLVVGSGPAGLAAAQKAAKRGHQVILCEEKGEIGGMLRIASFPPGRGELMELLHYCQKELNKFHVPIRLNTPLNKALIDEIQPEDVVLATGSLPEIPLKAFTIKTNMPLYTFIEVLEEQVPLGDRVLIIGGDQEALETADFVANKGKSVVVLHGGDHFAEKMAANDRVFLRDRLKKQPVQLYKNIRIKKIMDNQILCASKGETLIFEDFDGIVFADRMISYRKPLEVIKEKNLRVHIIGDAREPLALLEAFHEGDDLGNNL